MSAGGKPNPQFLPKDTNFIETKDDEDKRKEIPGNKIIPEARPSSVLFSVSPSPVCGE